MKETAAALTLACLMALGVVCVMPVKAQPYQGGITISADGSVSPLTPSPAPIHQEGDTYTLTSDVEGSIWLGRNDTVLDGNGHTITNGMQATVIALHGVSNCTVKNFVITGGALGISLWGTTSCVIANNTITGIGIGLLPLTSYTAAINVGGGSSNIIINNNMTNNVRDISLTETNNNFIIGNSIADENEFYGASNNTIYHNNFVRGNQNYIDNSVPSSGNVWDAGYPLGGNYWSNYLTRYPNASEIDSLGIGDTAYVSKWLWGGPGYSVNDRYPLMEPYSKAMYLMQTTPPKISMLNQTVTGNNVSLTFTVDKIVNWTGYSLDGQQNVTVTGNTTLVGLSSGLHNVTVYANDTYGNMAASETVEFTIPEPFPVVPVAAASVAAVVLVSAGLFVYFKKRKR